MLKADLPDACRTIQPVRLTGHLIRCTHRSQPRDGPHRFSLTERPARQTRPAGSCSGGEGLAPAETTLRPRLQMQRSAARVPRDHYRLLLRASICDTMYRQDALAGSCGGDVSRDDNICRTYKRKRGREAARFQRSIFARLVTRALGPPDGQDKQKALPGPVVGEIKTTDATLHVSRGVRRVTQRGSGEEGERPMDPEVCRVATGWLSCIGR